MNKQSIFLHIPKTGGTTLECTIRGTKWLKNDNKLTYRHLVMESGKSDAGDVFLPENFDKYSNFNIYTMLRHPVDRLVSEYYFAKDRQGHLSKIKSKPKTLKQFVSTNESANYMTRFFLGQKIYSPIKLKQADVDKVINVIDRLPIHVGIFEQFDKSLAYLSQVLGFKIPKKIEVKRVTLNRPKVNEISDEIREIIINKNDLDFQLYNHCVEKLNQVNVKSANIKFEKDRHSYVMKYTQRFILVDSFLNDKTFIHRNKAFFDALNLYLHKHLPFSGGKQYTHSWNATVVKAISKQLPTFGSNIILDNNENDPLINTALIASEIEIFSKENKNFKKILLKPEESNFIISPKGAEKKSLFGKLFGK